MGEEKKTEGFLVEIFRDDGIAAATWFDDEQAAKDYEDALWRRGYLEGISSESVVEAYSRYPIAQCRTHRFALSLEQYWKEEEPPTQPPPYTTTYSWREVETHHREQQRKDEKELLDHSKELEDEE